jgi:hypothetical protein
MSGFATTAVDLGFDEGRLFVVLILNALLKMTLQFFLSLKP